MHLVDEYAALLVLVERPPAALAARPVAMTYSRTYRLTRALLDPGPGRLQVRGRFSRLVDALSQADQYGLRDRLATPDPRLLVVIDPRPMIRMAGAIQNTYAVSLLQAETLAAAVANDWPISFAEDVSAPDVFRRAATQLGLDFTILHP